MLALSDTVERGFILQGELHDDGSGHLTVSDCGLIV